MKTSYAPNCQLGCFKTNWKCENLISRKLTVSEINPIEKEGRAEDLISRSRLFDYYIYLRITGWLNFFNSANVASPTPFADAGFCPETNRWSTIT